MSYEGFFQGSASVAGALVGLLFVALSVTPERLHRRDLADVEHQATAATAFSALVDALFLSLLGLDPGNALPVGALVLGTVALVTTLGVAVQLRRVRDRVTLNRNWPVLLAVIIVVYVVQLLSGLFVTSRAGAEAWSSTYVYILFGMGIARSWMLLGMAGTPLSRFTSHAGGPPPPEEPSDPEPWPWGT